MNDLPIDHLAHRDSRLNIPSAELEPILPEEEKAPIRVAFERRNRDLDPQLVWRGKDPDQEAFAVEAPPLYLQEHVHPKAIIEDFRAGRGRGDAGPDLFAHFGMDREDREAEVEFYRHSKRWSNRMILGDSLAVMASLAEREALRGQVQCIYIDPPYGIRFNSNFQWSTTSRDVKDGDTKHLTKEPEQVKAFRDTWRDGIHSYLGYLRDRLVVARELLTESGSCFVQIGDENVHRVRAVMDEVFGEDNFVGLIAYNTTSSQTSRYLANPKDYIVWYAKDADALKVRGLYVKKKLYIDGVSQWSHLDSEGSRRRILPNEADDLDGLNQKAKVYRLGDATSQRQGRSSGEDSAMGFRYELFGSEFLPSSGRGWSTTREGMLRLKKAERLEPIGKNIRIVRFFDDFPVVSINAAWDDTGIAGFSSEKTYVVQTNPKVIERCLLMTTDPGDLVLDPTCGSGTTAHVAEQWGRRWITIDTSRVALALARARIMGARYPYYLLADSFEGTYKSMELEGVTPTLPPPETFQRDLRQGFVYERVPHITLKSIANNAEIDAIWDRLQPVVEDVRARLNEALRGHPEPFAVTSGGRAGQKIDFRRDGTATLPSGESAPAGGLMEWEIPREALPSWPGPAREALAAFWEARIARQRAIDASIAARADYETLYDRPYDDKKRLRVAGPFTVESLSPHRAPAVNEQGELIADVDAATGAHVRGTSEAETYQEAILENLRRAGVHQKDKGDRIGFTGVEPWPGTWIAAVGRYMEGEAERRAGVLIGPEYGTMARPDLVAAAREAADAGFDLLIACAFNFDAHAGDLHRLGRVPILQARMNPDLHMAGELKAGGGNLFTVFGDPDIAVIPEGYRIKVEVRGLDIFRPATGEVETSEAGDIACWFLDTDYNEEAFFVRHAYFPGAELPYKSLRASLKAEVDEEAWDSLKRTVSRPFPRPKSGRIAVKVINHLGDEVMKVMGV